MRIIKIVLLCVFTLLLFSCASTGSNNGGGQGPALAPNSTGLGSNPGFSVGGTYTQEQLLGQRSIFFDFNQTSIKKPYDQVVLAHAVYLTDHPQQTVLLAGNTDVRGSREYNMGLGERRGQSVADMLLTHGVKSSQIVKISYGPEVPLACGQTASAYAQNRRVDILYCGSSNCVNRAKEYAHKMCSIIN